MDSDTEALTAERVFLALIWAASSVGLLLWFLLSGRRYLVPQMAHFAGSLDILVIIAVLVLAGMSMAVALYFRWRYLFPLAFLVTWPMTAFVAWFAAWSTIAVMWTRTPGTIVLPVLAVVALILLHRTRQVARRSGRRDRGMSTPTGMPS